MQRVTVACTASAGAGARGTAARGALAGAPSQHWSLSCLCSSRAEVGRGRSGGFFGAGQGGGGRQGGGRIIHQLMSDHPDPVGLSTCACSQQAQVF
eukprot:350093-Chlamydomonas_euryale.AAC.3